MVIHFKALKSKKYFSVLSRASRRDGLADEVAEAYPRSAVPDLPPRRIGIAKGEFEVPADIDGEAEQIRELFGCR